MTAARAREGRAAWVGIAGLRLDSAVLAGVWLGGSLVTASLMARQHARRIRSWRRAAGARER